MSAVAATQPLAGGVAGKCPHLLSRGHIPDPDHSCATSGTGMSSSSAKTASSASRTRSAVLSSPVLASIVALTALLR